MNLKYFSFAYFSASKKKIVLDLRRTRSSENLLHGADSTDLGQSLFEMGKPSIDQDSMVGVNGLDSIQETKRQESVTQPEEALKVLHSCSLYCKMRKFDGIVWQHMLFKFGATSPVFLQAFSRESSGIQG